MATGHRICAGLIPDADRVRRERIVARPRVTHARVERSGEAFANDIVVVYQFEVRGGKAAMVVRGDVELVGFVAVGVEGVRHSLPEGVLRAMFGGPEQAVIVITE